MIAKVFFTFISCAVYLGLSVQLWLLAIYFNRSVFAYRHFGEENVKVLHNHFKTEEVKHFTSLILKENKTIHKWSSLVFFSSHIAELMLRHGAISLQHNTSCSPVEGAMHTLTKPLPCVEMTLISVIWLSKLNFLNNLFRDSALMSSRTTSFSTPESD